MGKSPGTILEDPVGEDWKPDLRKARHDISEHFRDHDAVDLFSSLFKQLVTEQPKDPISHMIDFLKAQHPLHGPLKVIVSRAPGAEHVTLARQLADHFQLEYISAGEVLNIPGVDTSDGVFDDDAKVATTVMKTVQKANKKMHGFVLEAFPRTRFQTSFLKEYSIVPTHVLILKSDTDQIIERNRLIGEGSLDGDFVPPKELENRLRLHTCHTANALEPYADKLCMIDTTVDSDAILASMVKAVKMLPRSKGPKPPPRVIILGPRGVNVREHSRALASRLGAVHVDGTELLRRRSVNRAISVTGDKQKGLRAQEEQLQEAGRKPLAIVELPNVEELEGQDPLGMVGVRLRQRDCSRLGWVLSSFPNTSAFAECLAEDEYLVPTRVVVLHASAETCASRLECRRVDPVTGEVWTSEPEHADVRRRLQTRPEDQPAALAAAHKVFSESISDIVEILKFGGRCLEISADGPPEGVFTEIVEFVERPLPQLAPGESRPPKRTPSQATGAKPSGSSASKTGATRAKLGESAVATLEERVALAQSMYDVYFPGYAFPEWSLDMLAEGQLEDCARKVTFYYQHKDDIDLVKQVAKEREPVNIAMTREYSADKLQRLVGYSEGAYKKSNADFLMPNVAVYCPTPLRQGTNQTFVHVINVIGYGFDSKQQPDTAYFFSPSGKFKEERWDELLARMTAMWRYCFVCASRLGLKRVYLADVGGGAFSTFLNRDPSTSYERVKALTLPSVVAEFPHVEHCHLGRIPDAAFEGEMSTQLEDSLLVNAWDPWSMVGNGNEADFSLDGFFGRSTAMAVLCWPPVNPHIKYEAV
eukprot:TRINITY_DN111_c0_g3_i1.p1 TRINITY_DN111_c0_g3~~TRINITY_DN111_c0_g3_i1.p1  ORF type:complete len:818 (-),score=123.50 TRINITY_DN111_c0_g3_i1:23-2476(-)